jgi:hypothetical protein
MAGAPMPVATVAAPSVSPLTNVRRFMLFLSENLMVGIPAASQLPRERTRNDRAMALRRRAGRRGRAAAHGFGARAARRARF